MTSFQLQKMDSKDAKKGGKKDSKRNGGAHYSNSGEKRQKVPSSTTFQVRQYKLVA